MKNLNNFKVKEISSGMIIYYIYREKGEYHIGRSTIISNAIEITGDTAFSCRVRTSDCTAGPVSKDILYLRRVHKGYYVLPFSCHADPIYTNFWAAYARLVRKYPGGKDPQ